MGLGGIVVSFHTGFVNGGGVGIRFGVFDFRLVFCFRCTGANLADGFDGLSVFSGDFCCFRGEILRVSSSSDSKSVPRGLGVLLFDNVSLDGRNFLV